MRKERVDPATAPGRKARYRFEYERRPAVNIPLVLGVLAAGALATAAWVNGLKPAKTPALKRPEIIAAAPAAEPKALIALNPVRAETAKTPAPPPRTTAEKRASDPAPVPASTPPPPPPVAVAALPAPPRPTPVVSPPPSEARPAALTTASAVAPPTTPKADPCASIRGVVDRMLCADPAVRALDQRVDAAYRNALALTDNRRKVERDQARWLARRNDVGPGRTAVLAYYEERYKELWPVPMRVGPRLPPIFKPEPER